MKLNGLGTIDFCVPFQGNHFAFFAREIDVKDRLYKKFEKMVIENNTNIAHSIVELIIIDKFTKSERETFLFKKSLYSNNWQIPTLT